ncbi:XPG Iregion domain containing protein [Acanthamoeba castellanii str. Neff]|uniref:Flap endonuclease 1 n=1 Tax=Acanthamoeba castellanii (strain ATCC 30010 / Neff) TaxID=1257118 RepID=L8GZD0_ACACF|nr:XPG Iregion domain containing protein [Acanthamoeba castellanii str. Neff]ELR18579.1 XPG Iregion domain containing protein [Acanthamoeba castellanii str. Neff]
MALYAFLISIRPDTGIWLTDEAGETTSHLMGIWSRTLRLIAYGIKPVYVFDGRPPVMKGTELKKRSAKKKEAEQGLEEATELGDTETMRKLEKRTVHVTPKHNEECKKLLRLMGIPVVEAPTEAEAQCAELCRAGKVFATGSEDMDSLTFATPILLRHLNYAEAQKKPIIEIDLEKVLKGFGMTMEQFIDLCILAGCDYCDTIRGIGPKRALEMIRKYGSIEGTLKNLDKAKYPLPEPFPYEAVRELFKHPDVTPGDQVELKWGEPDEEGLLQYLVKEKQFNEERVRKGIEKLKKARGSAVQGRLDGFVANMGKATSSPQKKKEDPKGKGVAGRGRGRGKPAAAARGKPAARGRGASSSSSSRSTSTSTSKSTSASSAKRIKTEEKAEEKGKMKQEETEEEARYEDAGEKEAAAGTEEGADDTDAKVELGKRKR